MEFDSIEKTLIFQIKFSRILLKYASKIKLQSTEMSKNFPVKKVRYGANGKKGPRTTSVCFLCCNC